MIGHISIEFSINANSTLYDISVIYTFTCSGTLSSDLDDVTWPDVKVFKCLIAYHDVWQLAWLGVVLFQDLFRAFLGKDFVFWLVSVVGYLDNLLFRQENAPPHGKIASAREITSNPNLQDIE